MSFWPARGGRPAPVLAVSLFLTFPEGCPHIPVSLLSGGSNSSVRVALCLLCCLGQRGPLGDGVCRVTLAQGLRPKPGVQAFVTA